VVDHLLNNSVCIRKILTYKKGVSLLYRDSLHTTFDGQEMMSPPIDKLSEAFTKHVCVTDQNATAREMVGNYIFEFSAGGFFQNNNAILPLLVDYVRDLIDSGEGCSTHLVDTYCGAGLFAITLSSRFEKVAGIELSQASIVSAKNNAKLNRKSSPFFQGTLLIFLTPSRTFHPTKRLWSLIHRVEDAIKKN
jgi:tRNA (uracil-5-)-methyltransferase